MERLVIRMQQAVLDRLVKMFDIAYLIAKEEYSFMQYPKLVAIEKKHGVDLGEAYANRIYCRKFIGYVMILLIYDYEFMILICFFQKCKILLLK